MARRLDDLFTAGGIGFRRVAFSHAFSTGGDTLVTIALAGTLFFSVPSSEARSNVFGYLLLTVAPFALIGPLLGRLLDRGAGTSRLVLIASAGGRVGLTIAMMASLKSFWLFPAAFGLLVLSRVHGIARNSLLPAALDRPLTLVTANAKLAQIGVLGGTLVAPIGLLFTKVGGPRGGLVLAAIMFTLSTLTGLRVPSPDATPAAGGQRRQRVALPPTLRLAQLATAAVRFLNGFLVLLLAFAFKDADARAFDFGAVLGAAGLGYTLASIVSPALERRLREEPMVVAALAMEAAAAFIAGQWFGLAAAMALAAAAGFAWGTAKLAFDGLLQGALPAADRGNAFTRSETTFALAWVLGAVIPTGLTIPVRVGLVIVGLVALGGQVTYVAQLLLPRTAQPTNPPQSQ